jgi:hypothetical protein
VFLAKCDSAGNLLWTRQFGTSATESSDVLAFDPTGGVYMEVVTDGSLAGANAGRGDIVLLKFDDAGNVVWSGQIGSSNYDWATDLAFDSASGRLYLSGTTRGALFEPNSSGIDQAFVAELAVVPESSGLVIAGTGTVLLAALSRRSARDQQRCKQPRT